MLAAVPSRAMDKHKQVFEFFPRVGTIVERPEGGSVMWKTMSYGFTVGHGRQTAGDKYWHYYFGYPQYGFRLNYNNYSSKIYGDNIALFPYIQGPVLCSGNFSLEYSLGFGLAWHLNTWDPIRNPENRYVSSPLTAVIDMTFTTNFKISDYFDLFGGVGFSHYSNGATGYPNRGLNGFTALMGIRYYKGRVQRKDWHGITPVIEQKNEIYAQIAPSFIIKRDEVRQRWEGNKTFFCSTLGVGYKRQFHPCFKWGGGLDIVYMGNEKYDIAPFHRSNRNNLSLLTYASFEVLFGDVSLNAALGAYPLYSSKGRGNICERVGVFYHFGRDNNQFAGVSIKATKGSADYIEWTYGVRLFRF